MTQLTADQAAYLNNRISPAGKKLSIGTRIRQLEAGTTYVAGTSGQIPVCDSGGVAQPVTVSGDITITNAGVTAIGAGKVDYSKVDANMKKMIVAIPITADSLAADEYERSIFVAPFACTISKISVIPDVNFGQATNFATLSVNNKTQTATVASKAFSGGAAVGTAYTPGTLGTISNASLAADDVVTFKKAKTLTGEALPRMMVQLELTRAA